MRADLRYALLVLLIAGIIAMLALTVPTPMLYSVSQDLFPSRFHDNTDALKLQPTNSTTDVAPLMQDLLNFDGPIILNIRAGDIEQASRDLDLYARRRSSFNNLILKLDMNESGIKEFSDSKVLQQQLLTNLLNSSISLAELDKLEVQYRDQNNQNLLVSVQYQGDAIRKKVDELYGQYKQETDKVTQISAKYGLDNTEEEAGLAEYNRYVQTIDTGRENTVTEFPIYRGPQVSFLIIPDTGTYGDTIECFGNYFSLYAYRRRSVPDMPVTIIFDAAPFATVTTDDTGSYSVKIPVERISAGTHSLYAMSGTTLSVVRTLTIIPVNSTTTLSVSAQNTRGEVTCTGTVIANHPVRSAPVELVWDTTQINQTTTNANGEFTTTLRLPAGEHTLVARFTGNGYPVNPSQSEPQVLQITTQDYQWVGVVLVIASILLLSGAGAFYYLRRMPGWKPFDLLQEKARLPDSAGAGRSAMAQEPAATEPVPYPLPEGFPAPDAGSLLTRYLGILHDEGLSAATRVVYQQFAGLIARDLQLKRHDTLTPREISSACTKRPYCRAFSSFVPVYERIRYGGQRSPDAKAAFEAVMQSTAKNLKGERH
jgi:hypothetical protein